MTRGILVLVTGTGRSGTSTVAGSLHHLGLTVPGPFLGANKSNPKGFFESRWAVLFHHQLTRGTGIDDFDSRPHAFERSQQAITPERRTQLVEWLRERANEGSQIVVKDPRSVWAQKLWKEAAAEVGLDIRYLSMLRHPAEVVGSRATYYAKKADEAQRRRYEIASLARWLNNSLLSERETRGERRTFVLYTALLDDWRSALAKVRDDLGLTYNSDLDPGQPHPVDEFIDPDLRRVRVTWDDMDVPTELRELTDAVWEDLLRLREGGDEASLADDLDELAVRYARLFNDSVAIAHDAVAESARTGRIEGAAEERKRVRKARRARRKATVASTPAPVLDVDRPVRDVTTTALLRVVAERVGRRLRRG
jgi:hypothetical protein